MADHGVIILLNSDTLIVWWTCSGHDCLTCQWILILISLCSAVPQRQGNLWLSFCITLHSILWSVIDHEPGELLHYWRSDFVFATGIIKHGGEKPNIIPAYTELEFYLRTPLLKDLCDLKAKAEACFRAAAGATGCQVCLRKSIFSLLSCTLETCRSSLCWYSSAREYCCYITIPFFTTSP